VASSSALGLGDIALVWDNQQGNADVYILDGDVASERGLATAVLLSLFTDRRANNDDVPPSGDATDRRGWWGDQFLEDGGDLYGSRLWLLDRSTLSNETVLRATEYAKEALQWMVDDKVVSTIGVVATRPSKADAATLGFAIGNGLVIQVELQRPGKDAVSFRFAHVWDHVQEDI